MSQKRLSAKDRKAQIAIVAADLFAKRGFNGVKTREIAEKANVNEAMIFRYFPTKDALYSEIIKQKVNIEPELFAIEGIKKGDDAEVFKSVARHLINQIEEDNTFMRLMLFSALEGHNLSKLLLKSRANLLFAFLNDYIKQRISEGAFRRISAVVAIRSFIGMFFHFIMARELVKFPKFLHITDEEAIDGFVDIYLNGIKK